MAEPPCVPPDPRSNKDLKDVIGEPGISFQPGDESSPAVTGWIDDADYAEFLKRQREGLIPREATDTAGPVAIFGRMFRIPAQLWRDVERQVGIPTSTWYQLIEDGRNSTEIASAESLKIMPEIFKHTTSAERLDIMQAMIARGSALHDTLYNGLSARSKAAYNLMMKEINAVYHKEFNMTPEDVDAFLREMPDLYQANGDYSAFAKNRPQISKIGKQLQPQLQTGELYMGTKVMDAQVFMQRVIRASLTEKYLVPNWNHVLSQLGAFAEEGRIPGDVSHYFYRYLQEVRHYPHGLQRTIDRTVNTFLQRASQNKWFKRYVGDFSDIQHSNWTGSMVSMNYMANMGWNPGVILRQYLQTAQTTMPLYGFTDSFKAMKVGMRWLRDSALQRKYEQLGVVTRDIRHERFQEAVELAEQFSAGGTRQKVADWAKWFAEHGQTYFKKGDDFNRVVAYEASLLHTTKHVDAFMKGKIDFATLWERSGFDFFDKVDGPWSKRLQGYLANGEVEKANHFMAIKGVYKTQFQYSRGNVPYVMQSTVGRLFGQYGTWPAYFAEYMKDMALAGTKANKIKRIGRWAGLNYAIYTAAGEIMGADTGRWLFFSPLGYTGGPFFQTAQQGIAKINLAVTPGDKADPVDVIQAHRFNRSALMQTTPLPWAAGRNTIDAYEAMRKTGFADAMREFLGFPEKK